MDKISGFICIMPVKSLCKHKFNLNLTMIKFCKLRTKLIRKIGSCSVRYTPDFYVYVHPFLPWSSLASNSSTQHLFSFCLRQTFCAFLSKLSPSVRLY
jgi:hypothetical protein